MKKIVQILSTDLKSRMRARDLKQLIENSEAHLHPMKQRMMADVIGSFFYAGAYMQITTHSDYFMHRFSELQLTA